MHSFMCAVYLLIYHVTVQTRSRSAGTLICKASSYTLEGTVGTADFCKKTFPVLKGVKDLHVWWLGCKQHKPVHPCVEGLKKIQKRNKSKMKYHFSF